MIAGRFRGRCRSVALLIACVFVAGSCGDGSGDATDSLLATQATSSDISIGLDAIVQLGAVDPSHTVIVPTDDAVLTLDADALADLMSSGDRTGLIRDVVIVSSTALDDLLPGDHLVTLGGDLIPITESDAGIEIGGAPFVRIEASDRATVLVVDGIVAP